MDIVYNVLYYLPLLTFSIMYVITPLITLYVIVLLNDFLNPSRVFISLCLSSACLFSILLTCLAIFYLLSNFLLKLIFSSKHFLNCIFCILRPLFPRALCTSPTIVVTTLYYNYHLFVCIFCYIVFWHQLGHNTSCSLL